MKTLKNTVLAAMALLMLLNLVSCDKDKNDDNDDPIVTPGPLDDYTKIGVDTLHHDGFTAELYMLEDPFVGYNTVAVRVIETGTDVVASNINLQFRPMMDMSGMMHTTPVEHPVFVDSLEAYVGSTTFIMPSTAGTWSFELIGGPEAAEADTAVFEIEVMPKEEARLYSFVSAVNSTTSYFVALKEPMAPEVGLNDFEVMIYRRENMMSFPPATDLNVEVDPQMPTMGHGSPNNENPIHVEDGRYAGKVNFTMTGYWQVNIAISDSTGAMMDEDGFFDITFE